MRRTILIGKLQDNLLADVVEVMAQALGVPHEVQRASVSSIGRPLPTWKVSSGPRCKKHGSRSNRAALIRLEQAAAAGADRPRGSWHGRSTVAPC